MIRNMNGLELPCRVERRRARYQHIFGKSRHTLWPSLPDVMLYSIQHVEDIGGRRGHTLSCLVIILWSRQHSEDVILLKQAREIAYLPRYILHYYIYGY